ncbi:MAG: 2,3-bisphosphoglycerate-independent phosphoglycerate mutase [Eubacteriales bacterium]|nr:2,3-bisphosphoglycerate-independent phosphoglycerate mutase [Eubacteriales bacterium]
MVTLLILDGYGERSEKQGNAILGNSPKIKKLRNEFPSCLLEASGTAVGLSEGQMGNSETGHLNLGSGRVLYQDLERINNSIKDGSFQKNEVLKEAALHAKKNKSNVHIMGLLSNGGVHSKIEHAKQIILCLKKQGIKNIFFHAFLDGRDTPIDSGISYLGEISNFLKEQEIGQVITVSGRVYAMDREQRFERVQRVYNMLTGISAEGYSEVLNLKKAVEINYHKGVYDEFMPPIKLIGSPDIESGDVMISYNFRTDRMRELISALSQKNFKAFERKKLENLFVATMAEYDKTFKNVNVIFKPEKVKNCLSEVLAKNNFKQLRIAETTKYAHVTFFFNGGIEKPFPGEDRTLVESINVQNFSSVPKMRAKEITQKAVSAIKSKRYDFVLINLSNPDMIGHTGDFIATKKAIKYVDKCTDLIVRATLKAGGDAIVTADHGNAELMFENGKVVTAHTTNPVIFILASKRFKKCELVQNGKLANVSPTVLDLLGVKKPKEMTENSLLVYKN